MYDLSTELTWLGIVLCLSQSAMFAGLNLALFSLPIMQLKVLVRSGHPGAAVLLKLRENPNQVLATIIWGNVGVNCLLTLLSESIMHGVVAFLFSTVVITTFGEIIPQAVLFKHALRIGPALIPLFRVYLVLLYPIVKPYAIVLDWWLTKEEKFWMRETEARHAIALLMDDRESGIDAFEGRGAINFLAMGDRSVTSAGVPLPPERIIAVDANSAGPVFPDLNNPETRQDFLKRVHASGKQWVVLTDRSDRPIAVLNADAFLRSVLMDGTTDPREFWHRPVVVEDDIVDLQEAVEKACANPMPTGHPAVIVVWSPTHRRIIANVDILGTLFQGVPSPT